MTRPRDAKGRFITEREHLENEAIDKALGYLRLTALKERGELNPVLRIPAFREASVTLALRELTLVATD